MALCVAIFLATIEAAAQHVEMAAFTREPEFSRRRSLQRLVKTEDTRHAASSSGSPLVLSLAVTSETLTINEDSDQFQQQLMGVTAYGARGDFLWCKTIHS